MAIISLEELENKLDYFYSHFQCTKEQCFCYMFPTCTKGREMQNMDDEAFDKQRKEILNDSLPFNDNADNYLLEKVKKLKDKLSRFPYPYTFKEIRPDSVKTLGTQNLTQWINKEELEKEIAGIDSILNFQEKRYSPRKPITMTYKYYANDASRDYHINLRLLDWLEGHLGKKSSKEDIDDSRIKSWATPAEIKRHFMQLAENGFMQEEEVMNFLRANYLGFNPKTEIKKIVLPTLTQKDINFLFREFALRYDSNQKGRYCEMIMENFACFNNSKFKSVQGNFGEYPPKEALKFKSPSPD